jgi:nucleotide-binding universal stress UspA family protein
MKRLQRRLLRYACRNTCPVTIRESDKMQNDDREPTRRPRVVLCPVDFSDPSRGALRYAVTVAANAGARLIVLTVNDPLLAQAAEMARGAGALDADAKAETERFFADTFTGAATAVQPQVQVATGAPDREILRVIQAAAVDLVVMSSRGATGLRKFFLGSTTERVLRATPARVLVTPPADRGPGSFDELRKTVRRILVPVDLSNAMDRQIGVAVRLAAEFGAALLLAHVIEPTRRIVPGHAFAATVDRERRDRAERRIQESVEALPAATAAESLVVFGDPAEEIAKIAGDRRAGMIVIGLHASATSGSRMGSVTYRVLSITHGLVLAVPPAPNL